MEDFIDLTELENQALEGIQLNEEDLTRREYSDCTFCGCRFTSCDFSFTVFRNCTFRGCEWTLPRLNGTTFNGCTFEESKIIGADFSECSGFAFFVEFPGTLIIQSVFYGSNLSHSSFRDARIDGCDFLEANLKSADFQDARFKETKFSGCSMEKADFRNAKGYSINPESNKLKNARFSLPEAGSFLNFLPINLD